MSLSTIVSILGLLLGAGGVAALVTARSQAAKIAAETYGLIVAELRTELGRQSEKLAAQADELEAVRADMSRVHDWIDAGMPPPPPSRPVWASPRLSAVSAATPPYWKD